MRSNQQEKKEGDQENQNPLVEVTVKVKQLWETFEVGDHVREASGETMHTEFGATCAAGKVTCSKDKALGVSHSQGEVWLCPRQLLHARRTYQRNASHIPLPTEVTPLPCKEQHRSKLGSLRYKDGQTTKNPKQRKKTNMVTQALNSMDRKYRKDIRKIF